MSQSSKNARRPREVVVEDSLHFNVARSQTWLLLSTWPSQMRIVDGVSGVGVVGFFWGGDSKWAGWLLQSHALASKVPDGLKENADVYRSSWGGRKAAR